MRREARTREIPLELKAQRAQWRPSFGRFVLKNGRPVRENPPSQLILPEW